LQNGKWQAARYWKPDYDEHCQDTPDQACGRIEEIMEQAVKMELMSDVPLGIFSAAAWIRPPSRCLPKDVPAGR